MINNTRESCAGILLAKETHSWSTEGQSISRSTHRLRYRRGVDCHQIEAVEDRRLLADLGGENSAVCVQDGRDSLRVGAGDTTSFLMSHMSADKVVKFPCSISDLPTPVLVVDENVVKRNCARMYAKAEKAGVSLRPHVKTHKTLEMALMQIQGSPSMGIVASTLAEVRFFAKRGFKDITYSVPISAHKLADVEEIADAEVTIFVDSEQQVDDINVFYANSSHKKKFSAFLKIDSGYHRAGIDIFNKRKDAIKLAQRMHQSEAIVLRGIYSHSGHAYDGNVAEINRQECESALNFAKECRSNGVAIAVVSVGSTPTCAGSNEFPGVTEIHPGNYVFFDRQQQAVGGCHEEDIAATVLTRVVGHYHDSGHMLCDAGSLAMSKDKAPQDNAFGKVLGDDLYLSSVSQEVGKLVGSGGSPPDFDRYPLGTLLRVLPNHSCLTAALHPHYFILRGETVVGVCQPCRGW